MITEGSSALKLPLNPRQEELEKYLSAEDGYWIQNDIWRTDADAYRTGVVRKSRREGILADFTECQDVYMKLELKYYILYSLKSQRISPAYVQDVLMPVICLVGRKVVSSGAYSSFEDVGQNVGEPLPDDTAPTVSVVYMGFLKGISAFLLIIMTTGRKQKKMSGMRSGFPE